MEGLHVVPGLADDELAPLVADWAISLRARGLAQNTIDAYTTAVQAYLRFAEETGRPTRARQVRASDMKAFVTDQLARLTPGSANNRHRGCSAFFNWLVDEEEIATSPMSKMRAPKVPEKLVPFLPPDEVRALLAACSGTDFEARRDAAVIGVFLDTAIRRTECMLLDVADVDLYAAVVTIRHAKGGRERQVGLGARTTETVRRYLRARRSHVHAASPRMWVGRSGPLGETSIVALVARRCRMAGLEPVNLHRLRHTSLYLMKRSGYSDRELGRLAGWAPGQWAEMSARYGATSDQQLALDRHRSNSPLDQL